MGSYQTIQLQPFIKIPVQYEEYDQLIKTCGEHVNHKNDNFCPICGKEIKIQKIPSKSMVWPDDLIGNENLYYHIENETMYLLSNLKSNININTEENIITPITQELINEMIDEFKEKHYEDIKILEEKIKNNIVVEFGFLNKCL